MCRPRVTYCTVRYTSTNVRIHLLLGSFTGSLNTRFSKCASKIKFVSLLHSSAHTHSLPHAHIYSKTQWLTQITTNCGIHPQQGTRCVFRPCLRHSSVEVSDWCVRANRYACQTVTRGTKGTVRERMLEDADLGPFVYLASFWYQPYFWPRLAWGQIKGFDDFVVLSKLSDMKDMSTEWWAHLGYCYAALLSQLLFGLFAGIRVTKMRVKVLVQDLCGLLAEVPSFPSGKKRMDAVENNRENRTMYYWTYIFSKSTYLWVRLFFLMQLTWREMFKNKK